MKELSIKEKAERYDELLKKLRKAKVDNNVCDERYCCVIDDIVPELKESEDEKIRKEIINYLEPQGDCCVNKERWIAWLEKQGEKKHQYKSRPRYVGEDELLEAEKQELLKKELLKKENALKNSLFVEQKPVPKFEVGDVMRTLQEAANNITSGLPVVVSIDNDNEYYRCNNELIAIKDQDDYEYPPMNRRQKPAWSEQDDLFLLVCKNALEKYQKSDNWDANIIIDWLESKLKSIKPQPKQEWSEEDELALKQAIYVCHQNGYTAVENWLKSIKDRVQHQNTCKSSGEHHELEEFAKIVRCNLTGISKAVQQLFEAKYLQLTGNKMYEGFKD